MRLAFDARMASWGGVGTYTRELLAALVRDAEALGIESIVAFRSPEYEPANDTDPAAIPRAHRGKRSANQVPPTTGSPLLKWHVTAGSPFSPKANLAIGAIARDRADVFHAAHFPTPLCFPGALATTVHDLIPVLAPESMPSAARRTAFVSMVRWSIARSQVVICVSRAAAATVVQRFPAARVVVVHNGVRTLTERATATEASGTASMSQTRGVTTSPLRPGSPRSGWVLWAGAFKPHKDVRTLLAAHRRLPSAIRDRHPLVLVGDHSSPEGAAIRKDIDRTPDESGRRVHILGPVAADRLADLYRGAAVFAFPSRLEGFGMPPLEAMAHGTPVISSSAAPMPEILGPAALYFPTGDDRALATRILHVLDDPTLATRLRNLGAIRIERFTWESTARETMAAYHLALRMGRPRTSAR